jgi:hypothetical protein
MTPTDTLKIRKLIMEQDQRIARLQSPGFYRELNHEEIRLVKNPDLDIPMIEPHELEAKFNTISNAENRSQVMLFQAPVLPDWHMKKRLIIRKKNPTIFDFYQYGDLVIVSEKARKVIEGHDKLSHQYTLIELVDNKGNSTIDIPYYLMSVRRYVEVSGKYPEMPNDKMIHQMSDYERRIRSALINNTKIRNELADLPIWKLPIERATVFMSLEMLNALRAAGCTGLNDYKVDDRHKGSPVSYV